MLDVNGVQSQTYRHIELFFCKGLAVTSVIPNLLLAHKLVHQGIALVELM